MKKNWWFVVAICVFLGSLQAEEGLSEKEKRLIAHVEASIEKAEKGLSKLGPSHLAIEGLSSPRVRHFLNNLCSLQDRVYLEIGCLQGSTLIAATYGNPLKETVVIDNWSEYGGPRDKCLYNIRKFVPKAKIKLIEADCFTIDKSKVFEHPVDFYFYDGDHSHASQKNAFVFFDSVFSDIFVAVIDDWNWSDVRNGTFAAFNELQYEVLYDRALPARWNCDTALWWNGLYVAVLKKQSPAQ